MTEKLKNFARPGVSIIVAVYNSERFLERSLESIRNQTFQDWECLLIDDGSTDGSGEICDKYAQKDNRFRVIHKENGGVSSARRVGIDNASGIYSIHVDPDDWAEPGMLATMYETAVRESADMVICDFFEDIGNNSKLMSQNPGKLNNENLIRGLMRNIHGSCCNKLIRLGCYRQYGLNFIENLNYGEDKIMLLRLLQYPMKIGYCPRAFYHYVKYDDITTATNDFSEEMIQNRMSYLSYLAPYSGNHTYNELVMYSYKCLKSGTLTKDRFKEIFSPGLKKVRINYGLPVRKLLAVLLYLA